MDDTFRGLHANDVYQFIRTVAENMTLLIDRLHRASRMGCRMAAVTAVPDGVSARNLLRVGFQLLYTQAVMTRPTP